MKKDHYISLLYKKLAGEISAAEKEELSQWRKSSKENEQDAKSVEMAWNLTAPKKTKTEVDLDSEFSKLEDRLSKAKVVPMRAQQSSKTWLRIAAGVAILAVTAFLMRGFFVPETPVEWSEVQTQETSTDLLLADGSNVHLNTNSQLDYPQQFNEDERRVKLNGEAFFEIERDEAKAFIVEAGNSEITVLGTSFNISHDTEAAITTVYVATGKVQFSAKETNEQLILTKGESAIFDHSKKTILQQDQASPNDISWFTRQLVFEQTPIETAVQMIEQNTGLSFQIQQNSLKDCSLDIIYEIDNPGRFVEDLTTIFNAQVEKTGDDTYSIKGGSCE